MLHLFLLLSFYLSTFSNFGRVFCVFRVFFLLSVASNRERLVISTVENDKNEGWMDKTRLIVSCKPRLL